MADPRAAGTVADKALGCSQGQDLQSEKLLHLQSAPSTFPVSQGVRRWHLLHTEPTAASPGEQEKVIAQSPTGGSPTLCPRDLPTC